MSHNSLDLMKKKMLVHYLNFKKIIVTKTFLYGGIQFIMRHIGILGIL